MDNGLVKKTLRSLTLNRRTVEEVRENYNKLFPPSFLFRGKPSISLSNLEWALAFLVREGYASRELVRYLDKPLKEDTKVYSLASKGMQYLAVKKK